MRSLNTYNYREEVGFNAINYNVSISDDDRIIKIEDDGSLIAELSFALSNNTLYLNGKEGLNVAEIELPISMSNIQSQRYNGETQCIELEILKTDGSIVTFELNVEELVNVYTAGDGIDINDENVISIKIKDADNNVLSVSEEGLDISLDNFAKTSDLNDLDNKVITLSNQTNSLANQMVSLSQNIVDGFNNINKYVSDGFSNINSNIEMEKSERNAKDIELENRINDIDNKLGVLHNEDSTIANEIELLKGTDKEILSMIGELHSDDSTISETLDNLKGAIENEALIRENKDNEILSKIGELENGDLSIADEIASLKNVDSEILSKIGELEEGDTTIAESLENLKSSIEEEISIREIKDNEIISLLSKEKTDRENSDNDLKNTINDSLNSFIDNTELFKDPNNNLHYTLFVNGVNKGEINIPEDKMLEKVDYDADSNSLIFTWNTSTEQEPTVVDMTDLVDEYEGGNGIKVVSKSENSSTKLITIPTDKSNYTIINNNGQIDIDFKVEKDSSKSWVYYINDKNNSNSKVIDFTEDYNSLISDIQSTYAPISYVDEQDNSVLEALIGTPEDTYEMNTMYGLRAAIIENDSTDYGKIGEAKREAIAIAAADATEKDNALRDELKAYTDTSVNELKEYTQNVESVLNQKYSDLGDVVAKNSTDIKQLSTGLGNATYTGGTGLFDELHRLFHDLISGMDENNLRGKIQELINKVDVLQTTMNTLIGGKDVPGSIQNLIAESLKEAKSYADSQDVVVMDNIISSSDAKYQVKGDYVTNLELEKKNYIDEQELAAKQYVDEKTFNLTLVPYLTKDEAVKTYQPIGNYITEIPKEYVTEGELLSYDYATRDYVDSQDSKFISKEMADALYQSKNDNYVTLSEMLSYNYVDKVTMENHHDTHIGNATINYMQDHYINKNDGPFVTHEELGAKNYATKSDIEQSENNILTNINTTLEQYPTSEYVDNHYVRIEDFENSTNIENVVAQFQEGDNISINEVTNESGEKKIEISVKLSKEYNVEDTYSQGLPVKLDNLDTVSEKLSEAIKNLYDATDGELF